jgi:hypothetical protein
MLVVFCVCVFSRRVHACSERNYFNKEKGMRYKYIFYF